MTRKNLTLSLLVLVCCLAAPERSRAAEEVFPEYKLKAAFLYYFAKLTIWPKTAFSSPMAPIRIGVLGEDPFGPLLPETVEGKVVNGRKLVVIPIKSEAEVGDYHLLFISRSEKERASAVLAALRDKPVLTISEVERFANLGGMIRFVLNEKKVSFEINVQAVEAAGLQVSSTLGALGKLVKPDRSAK